MKNIMIIVGCLSFILTGCANKHQVVAATSTIVGLEIAQNQASQMYQAKLGYNRSEFAIIPSNRASGAPNDSTTGGGAADTTDVVMELNYANIFSLSDSGIYQRLAVGKNAVSQPGASLMFAKGRDGKLDPGVAAALVRVPAPDLAVTKSKLPLAKAFEGATDKLKFEKAAALNGYASFSEFLLEPNTSAEKVAAVTATLQQ